MSFDETVFITGFPGFIAGRLIERLALAGARLLLLVQPALLERARHDIERIAARQSLPANVFRILPGDITTENLGLSLHDLEIARHETNTIFHPASVDVGQDKPGDYKKCNDGHFSQTDPQNIG